MFGVECSVLIKIYPVKLYQFTCYALYNTIGYAIYLRGTEVKVFEGGTLKGTFGTYIIGDRFQVGRIGSTVTYKKNGVVFYTSLTSSTGNLLVDTALNNSESTIADARISGGI